MTDNSAASAVVDNADRHRFELTVDGLIAFANTRKEPGRWIITHVEAPPALRGTGAAGRLMQGVLDLARAEEVKITPQCGYARAWIQRHPEYGALLA